MEQYEHGGDIYGNPGVLLDFSVNTNPLGLPQTVREALITRVDEFTHYPDPKCRELCSAIAFHEDIPGEWILCGNGAADLIYRLCYAIKPCTALACAPTFSEYERALEQVGCKTTYYTLTTESGFELADELIQSITSGIDVLFLCNPNNPTGRLISNDTMERILDRARQTGTVVVVDECFLEFTDGVSTKRYLNEMPGLIILKAFTKMYTMAGIRLGYLLASDKTLLDKIQAAAQCWSVSVPAQIAGTAALTCENWPDMTRRLIAEERSFLSESINNLGVTVFPSDANFLLLRSGKSLYEPLLQRGILIRKCDNFKGLDSSYYRISIKTRNENSCLIRVIEEILNG